MGDELEATFLALNADFLPKQTLEGANEGRGALRNLAGRLLNKSHCLPTQEVALVPLHLFFPTSPGSYLLRLYTGASYLSRPTETSTGPRFPSHWPPNNLFSATNSHFEVLYTLVGHLKGQLLN